jgi:hypothetical protein
MGFLKSKNQFFIFLGLFFLISTLVFSVYYVFTENSFDDRSEASAPASLFRPLSWEVQIGENEKFTSDAPSMYNPKSHLIFPPEDEIKVRLFVDTQGSEIDGLEIHVSPGIELAYGHSELGIEFEGSCEVETKDIDGNLILYCFFLGNNVSLESSHLVDLYFSPKHFIEEGVVLSKSFSIPNVEFSYASGYSKPQQPNHYNALFFFYQMDINGPGAGACRTSKDCGIGVEWPPYYVCFERRCLDGDINNDGRINMLDFAEFKKDFIKMKKFGWSNDLRRSDLFRDNKISMADYSFFVGQYRFVNGLAR